MPDALPSSTGEACARRSIRRATSADAPSIAGVLREAFDEFRPFYTDEAFTATIVDADTLRRRLAEGPTWVSLHQDEVVGTVSAVHTAGGLYIRSMAVLPSFRGLGAGRTLLAHVEAYAIEQGHKRMYLSTTPFLHDAIRLYRRCGFAETDDGARELFGTPLLTLAKLVNQ